MGQPRSAAEEGMADRAPAVTPDIAAEAAVWVARLHGPDRSPRMEREFLAWQARSAVHREAFERCTETWLDVPKVTLASAFATAGAGRFDRHEAGPGARGRPVRWAWAMAFMALLLGGVALFEYGRGEGVYRTGIGEQRQVVLDDGTRMSLNTNTQVRVAFEPTQRSVSVDDGEALFEVAKDARRPFVVRVAGSEVVAVGTVFAVRFTPGGGKASDALAVTLVEGRVTVRPAAGERGGGIAPARPLPMQPGERIRLAKASGVGRAAAEPLTDRPSMEEALAWKRGEAVFDDTSLADAVAEMNRYSRTPIVLLGDAMLSGLRVSGVYRTGDNLAFAHAVAALHGLALHEGQGRLELGKPQ